MTTLTAGAAVCFPGASGFSAVLFFIKYLSLYSETGDQGPVIIRKQFDSNIQLICHVLQPCIMAADKMQDKKMNKIEGVHYRRGDRCRGFCG
jgi:hypothetical protein